MGAINRTMFTQLTGDDREDPEGVLFTQIGEGELADNQFWVSRDEAPDLIRMLADAFDLDLDEVAQ